MKILRASAMGHPCIRRIWYEMSGERARFDRRSLRNFKTGNALEPTIVEDLREDGWDVEYNQGSQTSAIEIIVEVDDNTVISGHPDIRMKRHDACDSDHSILGDIKTMNTTAFVAWRAKGTLIKYPQYADQLTIYGAGLRLHPIENWDFEVLAVVGFNKNNGEIHTDIFEYDPIRMERIIAKAKEITSHVDPPDPGGIPGWACSYCGFSHICTRAYGCSVSIAKEKVAGIRHARDEGVIKAAAALIEAKRMKAEAEASEAEAKSVISEYMNKNGVSKFQAGTIMVESKPSSRSSINTKALEAQYPEIAAKLRHTTDFTTVTAVDLEAGD